jgi:hypothetical protein
MQAVYRQVRRHLRRHITGRLDRLEGVYVGCIQPGSTDK